MKLFTAGLVTESTDLTPVATTLEDWRIERGGDEIDRPTLFRDVLTVFREMAEAKGWDVDEGLCATAMPPGGRIVRSVYEDLRTMILDDLQRAMPVDGVLLKLHGAALAHGYDDVEGDLLEHIRNVTGPDIPIGIELDPHCHLSDKMMTHATAIILYKTFAHTDMKERAVELFNIIADTLEGRITPVMALFDCRMIELFDESYEPMRSILESVCAREREPGILSISPVLGFPFAAIADMGSKMLVITDNDLGLARSTAEELGMAYHEIRGQQFQYLSIDKALDKAQEESANGKKSVQLLEWSDLAGCGFPTDGTELLQAMFGRGMTDVAVGLVWDPLAVSICHGAGLGAELILRVGGKACQFSGAPMDLNVVVEKIHKDAVITTWIGDMPLGDTVIVRSGDTQIVLVSKRAVCYRPQAFRDLGVEPDDKQYLLVKHAPGGEGGEDCIPVYGTSMDLKKWPSTSGVIRPKWPWDENPFDGA